VELGVVIGKTTKDVPRSEALAHVAGTRALDCVRALIVATHSVDTIDRLHTGARSDMSRHAKRRQEEGTRNSRSSLRCVCLSDRTDARARTRTRKGLPWTLSKGFDTFCPVSRFIEKDELPDLRNVELKLTVCIWL